MIQEISVAYTNETESQGDQNDRKNIRLSEKELNLDKIDDKEKVNPAYNEEEYEQIMQTFYSVYCRWTLDSLSSCLFPSQALVNLKCMIDAMIPKSSNESVDMSELKGTVYENYVIYSKNDINLQLLK